MKSSIRSIATYCALALIAGHFTLASPRAAAADSSVVSGANPGSTFVYTSYIKTTPEALWRTLTTSAVVKQYWGGMTIESDWKVGAAWKLVLPDGRIADAGEIIEFDPPRRLVFKWRNEINPDRKAEGYSRCIYEIQQVQGITELTITHEIGGPNSKFIEEVAGGWPFVVSNIKSLLETGSVVMKNSPDRR